VKILAVCTGQAKPIAAKSGRTGHFKTPVLGAVRVGTDGVEGDEIVDREHHGGPEQAVYVFTESDRRWWEAELDRPCPAGFFGENILIDGLDGSDLCLGDVIETDDVRLQLTAPRIPCVTLAARIGDPKGVKRFHESGRPGAYARVLKPGTLQAFDDIRYRAFDGERITVAENMANFVAGFPDPEFLKRLVQVPAHQDGIALAKKKLAALDC